MGHVRDMTGSRDRFPTNSVNVARDYIHQGREELWALITLAQKHRFGDQGQRRQIDRPRVGIPQLADIRRCVVDEGDPMERMAATGGTGAAETLGLCAPSVPGALRSQYTGDAAHARAVSAAARTLGTAPVMVTAEARAEPR